MKHFYKLIVLLLLTNLSYSQSNDSVDATFYYYPDNNPTSVHLRGEFNGWSLDNPMTYEPATSSWFTTIRLREGGPDPLPAPHSIPGAYQYKFYADNVWLPDPLNPRSNPLDNFNSSLSSVLLVATKLL